MYAIIEDGKHQFMVEEGQELEVDYRDLPAGTEVTFDKVLAIRDEAGLQLGQPTLTGRTVTAQVLGVRQGPKLFVQRMRRRKNHRRRTGHRQLYTLVKIAKIASA